MRFAILLLTFYPSSPAATICVAVQDVTGAPLPSVKVSAQDIERKHRHDRTLDEAGKACFLSLSEGTYFVEFRHGGFLTMRYEVLTTNDMPVHLPVQMTFAVHEIIWDSIGPPRTHVNGVVRRGGPPVPAVEICFLGKDSKDCRWTDPEGAYAIRLSNGKYNVAIGGIVTQFGFKVSGKPEQKFDLDLKP